MTIGERIKQRRNELQMSQRELASKLGYANNTTLAKIENGQVDLSQTRIKQFAEVLAVDVSYLMGWTEEKQPMSDELSERKKKFIKQVEQMSDAQLERLEQILALVETKE